jgi:hypothetical protein
MNYPSIFISNLTFTNLLCSFAKLNYLNVNIYFNNDSEKEYIICNTQDFLLFAHVNISAKNKLIKSIEKGIFKNNSDFFIDFQWGFIFWINKKKNEISLINDSYGVYPLFYIMENSNFILSNDMDGILNLKNNYKLNLLGIYDYFLFNYTLRDRTFVNEIHRIEGSSYLSFGNETFSIKKSNNDIDELSQYYDDEINIHEMTVRLTDHIISNLKVNRKTVLPLTGGFDSKIILSILLANNIKPYTFTFGNTNSPDFLAALSIAKKFNLLHQSIEFNDTSSSYFVFYLKKFLRFSPNSPIFDTLLYYILVQEFLNEDMNFISGLMGGELIVGPILISELITTKTSADLTLSKSKKEFEEKLLNNIKGIDILNYNIFLEKFKKYLESLILYLNSNEYKNFNIVKFLLNETYAKFFGNVFSILFVKFNLINPLVDLKFLKLLLQSDFSFINKYPFSKAPLSHFFSRRFYPLLIKNIYPEVLKSKMDRGYNLEDFLNWYRFPIPAFNYIKRHYFIKKNYVSEFTKDYKYYLINIAVNELKKSPILYFNCFNKDAIIKLLKEAENLKITKVQTQKLLQLLGLHYFMQKYNDKINFC